MPEPTLPPAALAFLAEWGSGSRVNPVAMERDLTRLLESVRAEAVREDHDCLYAHLCRFRQGIDTDERAGKLNPVAATGARVVVNTLIQGLFARQRTGRTPWEKSEAGPEEGDGE